MEFYSQENEPEEIAIDIKKYLSLFWQWAWLIALITILASVVAYIISIRTTPVFRASSRVLVDVPSYNMNEYTALVTSQQLTQTYSELMTKTSVLINLIDQLGLNINADVLSKMITVEELPGTQIIRITVESTDPRATAIIANTIVDVFSQELQEMQSGRYATSKSNLETQLQDVQNEIDTLTIQLQGQASETDANQLGARLAEYKQIFSSLLGSYEQIRLAEAQRLASVVVIESAPIPTNPIKPRTNMNLAVGSISGFLLSMISVFVFEALDDKINTPDDVKEHIKLPVLGIIDAYAQDNGGQIIAATQPRSPTAEEFRGLRTNLNYAAVDRTLKSLLITSAEPGEGKTSIVVNLAIVFAQSGLNTFLMDCDLRRPALHERLSLSNRIGLTSLIFNEKPNLSESVWQSPYENLQVITSGNLPPNPSEVLASTRMRETLQQIKDQADIVIIDTPPIMAVSDALVLAPQVDGVLIVIQPGKTKIKTVKNIVEQLRRANANLLGVVIKFMDGRRHHYARRYGYNTRSNYDNYFKGKDE